MPGDERRTAGGGGLGRDHAERLGEDRRHDAGVREREQVPEVAVLERAGEQRLDATVGGERLERGALGAESDDDEPGVEPRERLDQDVDALLLDQLAEVDDDGLARREEALEPIGVALVGQALLGVAGVRPVAAGLLEQRGEGNVAWLGHPLVDVDAGRYLEHVLGVAAHLAQDRADVVGADERRPRGGERFRAPGRELGVAAHRVLELGAVRLDGERRARRGADRAAEQDVIREDDIRRQERADRRGVGLDPGVELGAAAVLHATHVVALVAVEDEHRQQSADVGADGRRTAEVEALRVGLLGEDGDVVARVAPLPRQHAGVDVRAGAAEQVAVPEEDAHGGILPET